MKNPEYQALQQSEGTLRALFQAAPDGILVVDAKGIIVLANPQAQNMFGYASQGLVGLSVERLLPQRLRDTHSQHRHHFMAQPQARPMGTGLDLVGLRRDGSEFPVEVSLGFVQDTEGPLVLCFIADITPRTEIETQRQETLKELEARNAELDAFAHTVAHDLKNPLAILIGFAESLVADIDTLSSQELQLYLRVIARNGHKMRNIVDELLLLSSVRTADIETGPLNMYQIVRDAQERVLNLMADYEGEIILPHRWPAAVGYAPWVEEVWVNYLSNALQHGGESPRIELGATELGDGSVRFWIRDSGPGIDPEDQKSLFKPFTQLRQARTKGHGLGLSIVRRIVEKLDGEVDVVSQVGQGSTFSFTLPAAD
jgi:PAS domain S-box-containing protein